MQVERYQVAQAGVDEWIDSFGRRALEPGVTRPCRACGRHIVSGDRYIRHRYNDVRHNTAIPAICDSCRCGIMHVMMSRDHRSLSDPKRPPSLGPVKSSCFSFSNDFMKIHNCNTNKPLKVKRRKTKKELNNAKFKSHTEVFKKKTFPRGVLQRNNMVGKMVSQSGMKGVCNSRQVFITENRLTHHQGIFNHEIKSIDIGRLVNQATMVDLPNIGTAHPRGRTPQSQGQLCLGLIPTPELKKQDVHSSQKEHSPEVPAPISEHASCNQEDHERALCNQQDHEHASFNQEHERASCNQQDHERTLCNQQEHKLASCNQQDHERASRNQKDHDHALCNQQDHEHASCNQQDHERASYNQQGHTCALCNQQCHTHALCNQQDHRHASYNQQDHNRALCNQEYHEHASCNKQDHERASCNQQDHKRASGNQQDHERASCNQQDHECSSYNPQNHKQGLFIQECHERASCSQQDHEHSSSNQQDHKCASSYQKDHERGSCNQQDHKRGSCNQQDHKRASGNQQDHECASCNQQDHERASGNQQDYECSLYNQQDYKRASGNKQDHERASCNQQDHERASGNQQDHECSLYNQQDYKRASGNKQDHERASGNKQDHERASCNQQDHERSLYNQQDHKRASGNQQDKKIEKYESCPQDENRAEPTPILETVKDIVNMLNTRSLFPGRNLISETRQSILEKVRRLRDTKRPPPAVPVQRTPEHNQTGNVHMYKDLGCVGKVGADIRKLVPMTQRGRPPIQTLPIRFLPFPSSSPAHTLIKMVSPEDHLNLKDVLHQPIHYGSDCNLSHQYRQIPSQSLPNILISSSRDPKPSRQERKLSSFCRVRKAGKMTSSSSNTCSPQVRWRLANDLPTDSPFTRNIPSSGIRRVMTPRATNQECVSRPSLEDISEEQYPSRVKIKQHFPDGEKTSEVFWGCRDQRSPTTISPAAIRMLASEESSQNAFSASNFGSHHCAFLQTSVNNPDGSLGVFPMDSFGELGRETKRHMSSWQEGGLGQHWATHAAPKLRRLPSTKCPNTWNPSSLLQEKPKDGGHRDMENDGGKEWTHSKYYRHRSSREEHYSQQRNMSATLSPQSSFLPFRRGKSSSKSLISRPSPETWVYPRMKLY